MRPRYTVLLERDNELLAVGRFWCRANAIAFGEQQEAAGQGVLRGIARVLTTPMFRVELTSQHQQPSTRAAHSREPGCRR
jgi:hypothetical protein